MSDHLLTKADYRRQKTALTRAVNSKDPTRVLATCEKTLEEWSGKVWPDDWSRWSVALYDAWYAYERQQRDRLDFVPTATIERFQRCYERFA